MSPQTEVFSYDAVSYDTEANPDAHPGALDEVIYGCVGQSARAATFAGVIQFQSLQAGGHMGPHPAFLESNQLSLFIPPFVVGRKSATRGR